MGFRCVAVVGDGKGRVGVGCQAGREVSTATKRALVDAKKVRSGGAQADTVTGCRAGPGWAAAVNCQICIHVTA
jgi:ribosomal protein S5